MFERIRHHFSNRDSHHRQIALGFIWVSLFVFVGKLAGAAKEMTIAWRYGVSETVDAYVFVFNLINWPVSVWFSVLTVVLVPLAARMRHEDPSDLPRFRAELLGLTIGLGLALGVLAWLGLPELLRAGWLGLTGVALTEAFRMVGGLALLAPLGIVSSLFSAWLLAGGQHRNTLFEAIPAFTLLITLLLPSAWVPEPLIWGTVAGFALHMASLATPLHQRNELPPPVFVQRSPAWGNFWGSIGVMAIGQLLMSFANFIDQFFAAGLGVGALSTLSYANRVLALILGLGATAIGRATLPVFSAMHVQNRSFTIRPVLHWAGLMFVFGLGGLLVGWIAAHWVVSILFERGEFTSLNTNSVSNVLQYGLLQTPFYLAGLVFFSALSSKRNYLAIAIIEVICLIIKCISNYIFVDYFGISGLMISSAIMYVAFCLICWLTTVYLFKLR